MKEYKVPGLEKGLDILEALSAVSTSQSLSDLSKRLGRSSSELFRMVGVLEKRGYIVKDLPSGNYYLSLKLFELAHTHSPLENILKAAEDPMRKLAGKTRESCHLGVLRNGSLFILIQADGPEKLRLSIEVGASFSVLGTCSGRLLLSALSANDLQNFLNENKECTEMEDEEKHDLQRELEEIRDKGYSYAESEHLLGSRDISVLVGNAQIGVLAALTISSLTPNKRPVDIKTMLDPLKECAQAITDILGVSHIPFHFVQK